MDDGIFQLVFVLIVVIASVFDAIGRSKRKSGQPSELPPDDDEPGGVEVGGARSGDARAADAGTADTMVPPDLWAILTGEVPPEGTGRRPLPGREREDAIGDRSPVPLGDSMDVEPWDEKGRQKEYAEAATAPRRSTPSRPGVPAPRAPPGAVRVPPIAARVPAVAPRIPQMAPRIPGAPAVEGGRGVASTPPIEIVGRRGRSGGASRYTRLLASGRPDDLRKAIVLAEVLGPPVTLRDEDR